MTKTAPHNSQPTPTRFNFWPWVKLALGAAVVTYVLKSRLIDFESLKEVLFAPSTLLVSFAFSAGTTLACCFRWYLLARAQGINASFRGMLELMMIGMFFNLFMPGSVGGDLVKGWYIAKEQPKKRTAAVFTVLFDRAIGLSVFFLCSAITLGLFREWWVGKPALQAIAAAVWGVTGVMVLVAAVYFSPLWNLRLIQGTLSFFSRSPFLAKVIGAAQAYRNTPGTIAVAYLISVVSVTTNILYYSWLGQKLDILASLSQYFFLIPVGLTVSAVPILPGGIGVGQVAFFKLFQWVGIANPEGGSTLCTITQVYSVLFGCLGAIFYFKYRHKIPTAEVSTDASHQGNSHLARNLR